VLEKEYNDRDGSRDRMIEQIGGNEMTEYEAVKAMLREVIGLDDEELEFELGEYLEREGAEVEDLISLSGGREEHARFRDEWNARYPDYPVRIRCHDHDFGGYWAIEIMDFWRANRAFEDQGGVEEVAAMLADELGLEY